MTENSSENKVIKSWLVIRRIKDAKNCPHCDRELIGPEDAMARFHSIEAAQEFVERELMEGAPANKMKMVPVANVITGGFLGPRT